MLQHYKLNVETVFPNASSSFLTLDQIQPLASNVAVQLISSAKLKPKVAEMLEDRRKSLANTALQVSTYLILSRIPLSCCGSLLNFLIGCQ